MKKFIEKVVFSLLTIITEESMGLLDFIKQVGKSEL